MGLPAASTAERAFTPGTTGAPAATSRMIADTSGADSWGTVTVAMTLPERSSCTPNEVRGSCMREESAFMNDPQSNVRKSSARRRVKLMRPETLTNGTTLHTAGVVVVTPPGAAVVVVVAGFVVVVVVVTPCAGVVVVVAAAVVVVVVGAEVVVVVVPCALVVVVVGAAVVVVVAAAVVVVVVAAAVVVVALVVVAVVALVVVVVVAGATVVVVVVATPHTGIFGLIVAVSLQLKQVVVTMPGAAPNAGRTSKLLNVTFCKKELLTTPTLAHFVTRYVSLTMVQGRFPPSDRNAPYFFRALTNTTAAAVSPVSGKVERKRILEPYSINVVVTLVPAQCEAGALYVFCLKRGMMKRRA